MSSLEGLRFTPPKKRQEIPDNGLEGLRFTPPRKRTPKGDSWGNLLGKSVIDKGIGPLLDIPNLAAQGIEGIGRQGAEAKRRELELMGLPGTDIETPKINALSSNIPAVYPNVKKFVNDYGGVDLTPQPTTGEQRIVSEIAGFATPGAIFSFPGKIKKVADLAKIAKGAAPGAVIGGTSGALQEAGANPLVADLASVAISPYTATKLNPKNLLNSFKSIPEVPARAVNKIFGLSPRSLNVEAAQAARDLGIDLPAAALTDSKLTALADQFVGKTPYFGNKLQKKYIDAENQIKDTLNKIYEETGPIRTDEVKSKIANLYKKSNASVPQGAKTKPDNLKKAIDSIELNDTAILSPAREKLGNILNKIKSEIEPTSNLVSQFGPIKLPLQDYEVKKLLGTKVNLNDIIDWDEVKGVKELLKGLQNATKNDLAEYGKANPEWYKSFKEADELYGKAANRATLEELLGKSTNAATDNLSYNALSKAINSKKTNARIKRQVEPETFEKIQKLGKVAKALAVKNRNVPNPSGTAVTSAIAGVLGSYYTPQAVAAVVGTAGLTKVLTDKKLLDLALKYAEKPTKINSTAFNKHIKDLTGYSALALSKELNRSQGKEE